MKNKKDRGGYAVGKFFELLSLEKCRRIPKKVAECVKSQFAKKRSRDKIQIRPRREQQCVVRCICRKNNP